MSKKNLNLTFDDLYKKLEEYITDKDELDTIKEAYEFALQVHDGEIRLTNDPFIEHPLNVAMILTEIKADYQTICASLLHEVLYKIDESELREKFGDEITNLVLGVAKINKLKLESDDRLSISNHRKILVGLSEDVRVIIIKLADRLHNMRTLYVLPKETQKVKAKETLDILTPIAHRLGMSHIKGELEDLSLRYYKPDAYFSIVEKLSQTKQLRDEYVSEMMKSVSEILNSHGIKHEIKGRSKSIYSIYKKLDKGKKFSDIYDLLALRVFVNTKEECYQALGFIHSNYKPLPKRFKDYIAMPKTNMYQSLHTTVFGIGNNLFEIQIRTYEMDKIAENGIAAHWSYKEKGSNKRASMQSQMEQKLQFFRSVMELSEEENDAVEEVFKENVYVFTPSGDVIELPSGSTPIDFAYRVHTDVGDKMVGAIVNGNIVSLDYKLQDNDVVKINTNKNSKGPSFEWLNIAATAHAKGKIKSFFNKENNLLAQTNGQEELNHELKKQKISISTFNQNVEKILSNFKYNNIEELYTNIGNNSISAKDVIKIILNEEVSKEEIILKKVLNQESKKDTTGKYDVIVSGIDDMKVNVASCCKPIPGDNIVGFITKGYGITIHRSICPNITSSKRLIDVKWNEQILKKYESSLIIHSRSNVLVDIVSKTSGSDIVIKSMNTAKNNDTFTFEITVLVSNLENLNKFIYNVYNINDIIDIDRLIK